ncbi:hypothetical protein GH714_011994 [Hevea brasiliensis]|uniref:NAD(P)-binding domain-containing protein n=1 Tax=Hevea brasiliensis TaxID=3981 RepID=A0A6A6K5M5_HEVBR|nr:hypothetical protein GH714_011994 [Hevea brasiliensis]
MSSDPTPYEPKKILITGAAGFIASHVTNRLIKNYPGYKIVALDKLDCCSNLKNLTPCRSSPNFKIVKGDIASANPVNHLLIAEDIDTIMHFAAQTHVDNSFENSFEFTTNNIYGTHVLVEACKVTKRIRRPFNDQRYCLDDQKLKKLGRQERTPWEEGLKMTKEWYTRNPNWWGDVSAALHPHPRISLIVHFNEDAWLSENGCMSEGEKSRSSGLRFLIYGRTGWIGGLLGKLCTKRGINFEYGTGRLQDRRSIMEDIMRVRPTRVFNAAGVTGRPNVDWCESHKVETIRTNVEHPQGSSIGFKEKDKPNFIGSFYSKTKAMVEDLLKEYENVCTLRVRMPISSDLSNPRNFITKISRYNKVVNITNSMTVLDELLPISIEIGKRNCRGIWNFTNPRVISLNEILELYKQYIDPEFKWVNFNLEEQAKEIAPRSNNELDASKLKKEFPNMLSIKDSIINYVFQANKRT